MRTVSVAPAAAGTALALLLATLALPRAAAPVPAEPREVPPARTQEDDRDLAPMAEVVRGLDFLKRSQQPDGSFGPETPRIGTTALAALAFMANGSTPNSGPYYAPINKAIDYLIKHAEPIEDTKHARRRPGRFVNFDQDNASRMHGHAYATLALSQAYGMFGKSGRTEELRNIVNGCVTLILESQAENVGGWMYDPYNVSDHEGSMTVCMIQALRSARESGFFVPKEPIDRAVDYVRRSQKRDGSFKYSLTQDQPSFELTAAAISTLVYTGHYYDDAIRRGRDYLFAKLEQGRGRAGVLSDNCPLQFPLYGMFYMVQTLWFDYDHDTFGRYFPAIKAWYLGLQNPDGSFRSPGGIPRREAYGNVFATAFSTLTLQIPLGILPIFQR